MNLKDVKDSQIKGVKLPCPRCGEDTMRDKLYRNAFSRDADVFICDQCGLDEAVRAFMYNPLPLEDWAINKNAELFKEQ